MTKITNEQLIVDKLVLQTLERAANIAKATSTGLGIRDAVEVAKIIAITEATLELGETRKMLENRLSVVAGQLEEIKQELSMIRIFCEKNNR